MKKLMVLFLLVPFLSSAQLEESLKVKVGILKSFIEKGEEGEQSYWKTKGKVTNTIVNYTDEQNPKFKALFIAQYKEVIPVFNEMSKGNGEDFTHALLKILVRQEEDYRNLLTPQQLQLYKAKLTELEDTNPKLAASYYSLFFSDRLLTLYKFKFKL